MKKLLILLIGIIFLFGCGSYYNEDNPETPFIIEEYVLSATIEAVKEKKSELLS